MDSTTQAVFVLKVLLGLGPLAMYFLVLGLVNSGSRPCLVSVRRDFGFLVGAFLPLLALPLAAVIEQGHHRLALAGVVGVLALFFSLRPGRQGGWVLYNCSPAQARRLITQACQRLGWRCDRRDDGRTLLSPSRLTVQTSELPWLRSVTLRLTGPSDASADPPARNEFLAALQQELAGEAMLPSANGISLVVAGTLLLGLPMWYLFQHMPAIVEVVDRILRT